MPITIGLVFDHSGKSVIHPTLSVYESIDESSLNSSSNNNNNNIGDDENISRKDDMLFINLRSSLYFDGFNVSISMEVHDFDVYYGDEKSLDCYIQWAKYEAKLIDKKNCLYNLDEIRYIIEKCLSSNELLILKKTKKGIEKEVNYRNSLKTFEIRQDGTLLFVLKAGQSDDIKALRADDFLKKIFGDSDIFKIKRIEFYDKKPNVI